MALHYGEIGLDYKDRYYGTDQENRDLSNLDDAIKNYRLAYDFFKKTYINGDDSRKAKSRVEIIPLIDTLMTILIDRANFMINDYAYGNGTGVYRDAILFLMDMNNLIPNSANNEAQELTTELHRENLDEVPGILDLRQQATSISNPNNDSAPIAYNKGGLRRFSFGENRRNEYDNTSDVTNKRRLFLHATTDYGTAYEYLKKAYNHSNASSTQKRLSKEQIRQLTDALVSLCITHAEFLENSTNEDTNSDYQRSAINAYNIALSHLKDVKTLFPNLPKNSIDILPDSRWKSKLLSEI